MAPAEGANAVFGFSFSLSAFSLSAFSLSAFSLSAFSSPCLRVSSCLRAIESNEGEEEVDATGAANTEARVLAANGLVVEKAVVVVLEEEVANSEGLVAATGGSTSESWSCSAASCWSKPSSCSSLSSLSLSLSSSSSSSSLSSSSSTTTALCFSCCCCSCSSSSSSSSSSFS
jgi:hypothetical protein